MPLFCQCYIAISNKILTLKDSPIDSGARLLTSDTTVIIEASSSMLTPAC